MFDFHYLTLLFFNLSVHEQCLYVMIPIIILYKSYSYRYLKPFFIPCCISLVLFRAIYQHDNNLLNIFLNLIHSINIPMIENVLYDIIGLFLFSVAIVSFVNIISIDIYLLPKHITDYLFGMIRNTSIVQNILNKEQLKLENDFDHDLKVKSRKLGTLNNQLPQKGMKSKDILKLMQNATLDENVIWENGKVSGAVYHGQHKHIDLLNEAFSRYSISNPLHPDIWPSVMKFESEIIAMTASLVNGSGKYNDVCGATTSGGTESIILAIKAHRDYYRDYHGISKPEIIVGNSAHAAVDKACDMMNIKLIKVDLDSLTFKINLKSLENAITSNTILLYASAPSYPHGAIDPISQMGRIALKYSIGLHVDCCLGGFVLPFAKKLGYNIPDFDFTVPGVTSMSLDTHKYGYALKGTSVVLYNHKKLRQSQYFCYADWTGGMYTTPTIAGSRSGGLIAQCWASMMVLGEEGYNKHTKDILEVTQLIANGIPTIPGVKLLGYPDAMIVCFDTEKGINIYSVGDNMTKRGWSLNALQHPPCLHICCTVTHVNKHQEFLSDLRLSVDEVRNNPNSFKEGKAAIYGMTSSLPAGPVNELLKVYNDVVLKV